jgi:EF hand
MPVRNNLPFSMVLVSTLPVLAGCLGSQSRLAAPKIASGAAEAAVAKCDSNGDGAIAGDELRNVPALKASLKRVDTNSDGKVSAQEIADRIAVWKKSGIGLTRAVAWVRRGGRPVENVEVTFVPEEFLGPNLKPASGTTDSIGAAHVRISANPDERGIALGYYRVQLSKRGPDGKETIPARYNSKTELGVEVTPDDPALDRIAFDISN